MQRRLYFGYWFVQVQQVLFVVRSWFRSTWDVLGGRLGLMRAAGVLRWRYVFVACTSQAASHSRFYCSRASVTTAGRARRVWGWICVLVKSAGVLVFRYPTPVPHVGALCWCVIVGSLWGRV